MISATTVASTSAGSVVHSFMIWRGPDAANAVTDDTPSGAPRSVPSGSHGAPPSSSSARHHESLPGWPSVERSSSPGRTSRRLRSTSRTARPMHTDARSGPASTEWADDMPSWRRTGPFTTSRMAHPPVDAVAPCTSSSGRHTASTRGEDDREVGGQAPGQHGVDGDLLGGEGALLHRLDADDVVGVGAGPRQHGLDPLRCGRDDGQAVGPAPVAEQFLDGVVVHVDGPGAEPLHGSFLVRGGRARATGPRPRLADSGRRLEGGRPDDQLSRPRAGPGVWTGAARWA